MEKHTSFTNWSLSARTRSESEKMSLASDGGCSEGIAKWREKTYCTEREKTPKGRLRTTRKKNKTLEWRI
jgi:hypothetical protein